MHDCWLGLVNVWFARNSLMLVFSLPARPVCSVDDELRSDWIHAAYTLLTHAAVMVSVVQYALASICSRAFSRAAVNTPLDT